MAALLRPLLRRPARLSNLAIRPYATSVARPKPGLTALVTGICGIALGFGAAQFFQETKVPTPHKPTYGTAKEFSQATGDLRKSFSARSEAISTDPDDLKLHGLSTNTYHTGAVDSLFKFRWLTFLYNFFQASTTVLSCIQNLQRMWSRSSRLRINTRCQSRFVILGIIAKADLTYFCSLIPVRRVLRDSSSV